MSVRPSDGASAKGGRGCRTLVAWSAGVVSAVVLLSSSPGVSAQTASQLTPATARPLPRPDGGRGIVIPATSGPEVPAGAAHLTVRLSGVTVEGEVDLSLAEVAAVRRGLEARLVGRTIGVAEVFAAARDLEAAHARAGRVLTRVVVPPQRLTDGGRLRLIVVAGFVERVDLSAVPEPVRGRIEALVGGLVGRRSLDVGEIERDLLLAADTPGTTLRSTLTAGRESGGSVLVLEARHRPITGTLSADNSVSHSLGGLQTSLALQANGVFGFGEQFYLQAGGLPRLGGDGDLFGAAARNRQLSIGTVVPIGLAGTTFNVEATRTDSSPSPTGAQIFASRFERLSARLRHPLVRSRAFSLIGEVAFDAEEEEMRSIAPAVGPLSLDRLRVLRVSEEVVWTTPWDALVNGRLSASFGIDGLGARDAASATALLPLSRQGSDAAFGKLDVALHYGQTLHEHLTIDLFGRAQTSFGRPLPRAEQFSLTGAAALSAFDTGAFQGDSGLVGRLEVASPWRFDRPGGLVVVSPYAFGAWGEAWLMQPTAVETASVAAAAWGLGLKLGAAPNPPGHASPSSLGGILEQTTLTLEWGHQNRSDGQRAGDAFRIQGAVQF